MRITIENTSKVVTLTIEGAPVSARIWEGFTESGIPVHCYITRIAVHKSEDASQFDAELREIKPPSAAVEAIPLRMIL
jgi:hypothetical protein